MRGRGRGGRGGRSRDDFGVPRPGPITEEAAAYPPNPRLSKAPTGLEADQHCLVALNRILTNYWKFQSPFQVQPTREVQAVQTYSGGLRLAAAMNPTTQMERIIAVAGAQYFPTELQREHYVPPKMRRARKLRPRVLAPTEGEGGEGAGDEEDEEAGAEEEEEFGGEDYVHNHYADEDREELDEGGGDEEAF